jgi:molecular chaperone Hsp31 and glyoxalase 3
VVAGLDAASDYAAVFIPGGHGALIGLPQSRAVKAALHWAMAEQRHIITLCHGPAALLAAGVDEADGGSLFRGYRICAFPDAMDRQTPEIGYMPGQLRGSSVSAWRSRACRSSTTASMAACCRIACC